MEKDRGKALIKGSAVVFHRDHLQLIKTLEEPIAP
jgi:hypothetical protein